MPAVDNSMHAYAHFAPRPAAASAGASAAANAGTDKDDGFSFSDLLDVVNPLQHIPVVGTLYRKLTGDQISTPAKILGDTLFGGLTGLASSVADTAFEAATGKNFGDTVLSLFDGGDAKTDIAASDLPKQELALNTAAPSVLAADTAAPVQLAQAAGGEPAITAALNRAQLASSRTAQAQYAYGQAASLAKAPDVLAAAY